MARKVKAATKRGSAIRPAIRFPERAREPDLRLFSRLLIRAAEENERDSVKE